VFELIIQLRRDTPENWQKFNPVLSLCELCLEVDDIKKPTKIKGKIGDNVTAWNDLPYCFETNYYFGYEKVYDKNVPLHGRSFHLCLKQLPNFKEE
jgi:hypothetical protein